MGSLRCFNKGCGKQFDPEKNGEDSCVYHPGEPIFHDAKKKWSCCKKYSTDFTEFLNVKGCATGLHNPEKPKTQVTDAPKLEIDAQPPMPVVSKQAPKAPFERPSRDAPLITLTPVVSTSLKNALAALKKKSIVTESEASGDQTPVSLSTPCCNSGCKSIYSGPESNTETCMYHSGVPIFHEGLKFWSCCQRKTTEFDMFLTQEGCTAGRHAWTKEAASSTNLMASPAMTECRFDWFQMPETVTLSIYAKNTLPESANVGCNGVSLTVAFLYDGGNSRFEKSYNLFGVIDVEKSRVNLMATKVEIVMRKSEACSWSSLESRPDGNANE